jgi:hypothetical protein
MKPERRYRLNKEIEEIEKKTGMKIPAGVCVCLQERTGKPIFQGTPGVTDIIKFMQFADRMMKIDSHYNHSSERDIRTVCSGDFKKL